MSDPRIGGGGGVRVVELPGCLFLGALLLFLVLPLSELALLVYSARHLGFWWTLLLCVATAVAGSWIARWQGTVTLRRAQEALARGELPSGEILDGAFLLVGGVLLLTPGFLTDVMGLAFLLPPSRALLKSLIRRWWRRRQGIIDVRPR